MYLRPNAAAVVEILGSNLGREASDYGLAWYSSVRPVIFWGNVSNFASTAYFYTISNSLFINHPPTTPYIVRDADSVDKQTINHKPQTTNYKRNLITL
jgi:hypothetical protein